MKKARAQWAKRGKEFKIPISLRPKYINQNKEYGHWELDTIKPHSKYKGTWLSLIERKSKLYVIIPIENPTMINVYETLKTWVQIFNLLIKSIITDNGSKFNLMWKIKQELGVKIYYSHPYSPQEKGMV